MAGDSDSSSGSGSGAGEKEEELWVLLLGATGSSTSGRMGLSGLASALNGG